MQEQYKLFIEENNYQKFFLNNLAIISINIEKFRLEQKKIIFILPTNFICKILSLTTM